MTEREFTTMVAEGKVYTVDITLREMGESYEDFIVRAKCYDLGNWVVKKNNLKKNKKT